MREFGVPDLQALFGSRSFQNAGFQLDENKTNITIAV